MARVNSIAHILTGSFKGSIRGWGGIDGNGDDRYMNRAYDVEFRRMKAEVLEVMRTASQNYHKHR